MGDLDGNGMLDIFISGITTYLPPGQEEFQDLAHDDQEGSVLYLNKKTPANDTADYYDSQAPVYFDKPKSREWGIWRGYWGWGTTFLDYDNDGDLDLAEVNGFDMPQATEDDGQYTAKPSLLYENVGYERKMVDRAGTGEGKLGFASNKEGSKFRAKQEIASLWANSELTRTMFSSPSLPASVPPSIIASLRPFVAPFLRPSLPPSPLSLSPALPTSGGLLTWDFDSDGDLDIMVINNKQDTELFENQGGNKNAFINVRALEPGSGRDSIGAMVYVKLDSDTDKEIVGYIGTKEQFLVNGEVTAHFGLGQRTAPVFEIRVVFPRRHGNAPPNSVVVRSIPVRAMLTVRSPTGSNATVSLDYAAGVVPACGTGLRVTSVKQPLSGAVAIQPGGRFIKFYPSRSLNGTVTFEYTVSDGLGGKGTGHVTVVVKRQDEAATGGAVDTKWRPFDGYSNNLDTPLMGCPFTALRRRKSAAYGDGVESPAGSTTRPSARKISNEVFSQVGDVPSALGLSDLHAHFGQFVAHDTDFSTPFANAKTENNFPIKVPPSDPIFDPYDSGTENLRFQRSGVMPGTGHGFALAREQFNKISSYLDLSTVYGSGLGRAHVQRR